VVEPDRQYSSSLPGHSIAGVRDEIEEDLAELLAIGVHEDIALIALYNHGDLAVLQVVLDQVERAINFGAEIERTDLLVPPTTEFQHASHEACHAIDLPLDDPERAVPFMIRR
jgi:hypothetical protein